MDVFKYTMNVLRTRLILEWQDLSITYPLWLHTLVMDELYYVVTILVVSANCFVVGLALGFIVTLV